MIPMLLQSSNIWLTFINIIPLSWLSVLWCCWLGSRKDIRPIKNRVVGYWHGYLSVMRCRFAYGPANATATHWLLLQIGFTFLLLAHPGSPRQNLESRKTIVVVQQYTTIMDLVSFLLIRLHYFLSRVTERFIINWNISYGTECVTVTCRSSRTCGPDDNTVSTQAGSLNVTNPKPRDFPVVGFFMTTQSMTSP